VAIQWQVTGGDEFKKQRGLDPSWALAVQDNTHFIAQNVGDRDDIADVAITTVAQHPQANLIAITAVSVIGVFLVFLLISWLFPKASAIALATAKSEMSQPLFLILVAVGLFALLVFMFVPYHTFGEDIKVLKDSGLTLIMVFAIFHAVWAASNSVAEEIEGRTAITVLSKPIGRRQFILGKFLGISWTSAVMFILLGVWFLLIVAYKPIYDARETANTDPTWQACHIEMVRTVPGLVLAFFETLVFAAIGVAISTRLPLLANLVICFAIYAFGHLTPLLVQAGEGQFEGVRFVAQFIATVLPVLDHFNIQAAVAAGVGVPMAYLGTALMYCVLYCGVALLLALALFEDRDVA
jgi:ABC-type transport system involved in multi-copper enzyme maturation permease subunit